MTRTPPPKIWARTEKSAPAIHLYYDHNDGDRYGDGYDQPNRADGNGGLTHAPVVEPALIDPVKKGSKNEPEIEKHRTRKKNDRPCQ